MASNRGTLDAIESGRPSDGRAPRVARLRELMRSAADGQPGAAIRGDGELTPFDRAQYALTALDGLVDLICAAAPGTLEVDAEGLACLLDILHEQIDGAVSCLAPEGEG